ncbi:MAG: nucleotidyltransferase family protein [Candidatus Magasanikbacteria bacterium]|nr:nucleotidyltransferase family protein [Candidatus Magasanikbacteria bacterium]
MTKALQNLKKQITPTLRKYSVGRSFIFGSTARGTAKKTSDVDLVVDLPKNATLLTLISLQQELEDRLGRSFDVTTSAALSPRLKKNIARDAVRVL